MNQEQSSPVSTAYGGTRSGCWRYAAIGCVVLILLGLVGGYFAYRAGRKLVLSAAATKLSGAVEVLTTELALDQTQKDALQKSISRLTERMKKDDLSLRKFRQLLVDLGNSPLAVYLVLRFLDQHHLAVSGLSEEEKGEGRRTMDRLVRATAEQKITRQQLEQLLQAVPQVDPSTAARQIQPALSDGELRSILDAIRQAVDTAQIPDETYTIDVVGEVERLVEKTLGEP